MWNLSGMKRKHGVILRKHGIPFDYATAVFDDPYRYETPDLDEEYGEERWLTIGIVKEDELTVISVARGAKTRLISARRATSNERAEYWENRLLHL